MRTYRLGDKDGVDLARAQANLDRRGYQEEFGQYTGLDWRKFREDNKYKTMDNSNVLSRRQLIACADGHAT